MKKVLTITVLTATLLLPAIALAAAYTIPEEYRPSNAADLDVPLEGGKEAGYGAKTVNIYIQYFTGGLLAMAGVVAVWAIVNAGFNYAIAGGNQEKLNNAKKELLWASLGLATVIFAFFLVQVILNLVVSLQ